MYDRTKDLETLGLEPGATWPEVYERFSQIHREHTTLTFSDEQEWKRYNEAKLAYNRLTRSSSAAPVSLEGRVKRSWETIVPWPPESTQTVRQNNMGRLDTLGNLLSLAVGVLVADLSYSANSGPSLAVISGLGAAGLGMAAHKVVKGPILKYVSAYFKGLS